MRNLKRVLSLALACVMVIGMMVMTTGAADFDDAAEIEYTEAVDVMSALGVLEGHDGTYNPDGELTRDQAAKIICYMLMGPDKAVKLEGAGSGKFDDTKGLWSEGYVEYCYNLGIIDGYGNGNFGPGDKLLAVQFGKMLLCALGYDAEIEGYGNDNWATNIATDMIAIGLDLEGVDMDANLTREQAAQMAFTALTKTMVTYNGMAAYFGFAEAEPVDQGTYNNYDLINGTSDGLQFCEKYFPNLKVIAGDPDDFGRPASHKWFVAANKAAAGFNPVTDSAVHNAAQTASYTYNVTGQNDTDLAKVAAKLELDVNGAPDFAAVKGDTVELFFDANGDIYDAVCLHTELAVVSKVLENTDEDAKFNYTVTLNTETGKVNYQDTKLDGFDAETMVKDTYVTLTKGGTTAVVALADSITGKQTAKGTGYVKIDGVQKYYSGNEWDIDALNYTSTFDFYLDAKGLVIGYAKVSSAPVAPDYLYVDDVKYTAASGTGVFATAAKVELSVVYLDGTTEIVDMVISTTKNATTKGHTWSGSTKGGEANMPQNTDYITVGSEKWVLNADAVNALKSNFYSYTLNDDGDIAKLTALDATKAGQIATDSAITVDDGVATVGIANKYADSATVLTVLDDGEATSITGYKNFPDSTTFTVKATPSADGQVEAILYTIKGDIIENIYVLGGALSVAEDTVLGVYVETGDTYSVKNVEYKDVVYNVDGENVTYRVASGATAHPFAEIDVVDGVVTLTDATASGNSMNGLTNLAVDMVTDSYILVVGSTTPVYFASDVAYFDITNIAKNGVVADEEVVVGDIISYTTKTVGLDTVIDTIFITYEAQEDGTLAKNDATYLEKVIGFTSTDSTNAALTANKDWVVIQYTRPQNMSTGNVLTVKSAAGATVYTETNSIITAGIGGFMIDPNGSNTNGPLTLTVGDTYTYTIACDGVVVCTGSFIVK